MSTTTRGIPPINAWYPSTSLPTQRIPLRRARTVPYPRSRPKDPAHTLMSTVTPKPERMSFQRDSSMNVLRKELDKLANKLSFLAAPSFDSTMTDMVVGMTV